MNNTTFTMINSTIKFYDKIYDEYNSNDEFGKIVTITAKDIKDNMPLNLKSPTKLKLFDTFGENVTQEQFVELLMLQTSGADFLNIIYIIKYYNLKLDQNGMIIWNKYCAYQNFRMEALQNWYVWNLLSKHAMFNKYMDKLLEFQLQTRIEDSIFPMIQNFKQDMHFINAGLIVECNEGHHELLDQKILDTEKIALNKMNGNTVISLYTNSIVDIKQVKKNIYDGLYNDVDSALTTLLEEIYLEYSITDMDDKQVIRIQMLIMVKEHFKIKYLTKPQKLNKVDFKKLVDSKLITFSIQRVLHNYLEIINETIHANILDNNYLKCYKSTLVDILLSSCLNNFEFCQDYIKIILGENLVDYIEKNIDYLVYIKTDVQTEHPDMYKEMYNYNTKAYSALKIIASQFMDDPEEFIGLFNLKLKSMRDLSINMITFEDIKILLGVEDITKFRRLLNSTCSIKQDVMNEDIRISWKQLSKVIFSSGNKPELKMVLVFYYSEIDVIYEQIIRRMQQHSTRLICTPDDYNNYMGRIYKKFSNMVDIYTNHAKKIISHVTGLNNLINKLAGSTLTNSFTPVANTLIEPAKIVIKEIVGFKYIDTVDQEMIARYDFSGRIEMLNTEFIDLTEDEIISTDLYKSVDILVAGSADPDEVV